MYPYPHAEYVDYPINCPLYVETKRLASLAPQLPENSLSFVLVDRFCSLPYLSSVCVPRSLQAYCSSDVSIVVWMYVLPGPVALILGRPAGTSTGCLHNVWG